MNGDTRRRELMIFLSLAGIGWCGASAAAVTVEVLSAEGDPVADAVVYAEPLSGSVEPAATEPVLIEQKNKTFRPFVSAVSAGTRGFFPNRDGIGHHVYSFSPAKTFQLPLSDEENSESVLFDKPGVITVGCNIHDWMVAYVLVLETSWHAVTDSTGTAVLEGLPEGEYRFRAWHPGIGDGEAAAQQSAVAAGADPRLRFTIEVKPEYFWRPARPEGEELY